MRRTVGVLVVALLAAVVCASDGGDEPTATGDFTLVNLNLLHGVFCPADTEACRAPDRVDLFLSWIGDACPDVVALQEIDARLLGLIEARARSVCDGAYELVWHGRGGVDRELVLSALPVVDHELRMLAGDFRSVFRVGLDAAVGRVELFVTHLASSDNVACTEDLCPPPCDPDGEVRVCQATQVAEWVADVSARDREAGDVTVVVAGDLNDVPASATVRVFTDGRSLIDTHLAAGNAECDPATGRSCTSGRADRSLDDLTDPASRQDRRIDYVLVGLPDGCDPTWGAGLPTGLFRERGEPGGFGDHGLVHPSDHTAVALDLACR